MSKKKKILLGYVIQEYLKSKEPIGSEFLKSSTNLKISSATIRNYFKDMMEEGLLLQPHISSGRIPSHLAFKEYWRHHIALEDVQICDDFSQIEKISREIGCFASAFFIGGQKLIGIENIQDRFIVLAFSSDEEVILRFSAPLLRFVEELKGMDIEDIKSYAHQVNARDFGSALESLAPLPYRFCGAKYLAPFLENARSERLFFELVGGDIFKRLDNGIFFDEVAPKGYVIFVRDAIIGNKKAKVLYCGALECDYLIFNL